MNIYEQKSLWKLTLMFIGTLIVTFSLWYSNKLVSQLAIEERKKVELWAEAYNQLNQVENDFTFLLQVIQNNKTVPAILTDKDTNIIKYINLDSSKVERKSSYLQEELKAMLDQHEPIEIKLSENDKQFIFYKESVLLTQLRHYPLVQFGIIGIFLLISYFAFSTARKAEQNQVWVGMSKETAHQLGTPLSSLIGWIEYMRAVPPEQYADVLPELEKDVDRLNQIAERFSKVGSPPALKNVNIKDAVNKTIQYLKKRSPEKVTITLANPNEPVTAKINPPLFDWVIENLVKNALNAMEGKGNIKISITESDKNIIVDVQDTGKGIPKSKFKTVFKPGYTTRKRGWGLGLSLTKRIIEDYHKGKIYVKDSTIGIGTCFRILFPKNL